MSSSDLFQRLWQELVLPPGASRPPLTEQEVECLMRDRVSLLDGRTDRVVYAGGVVILTSHRIIWHSRDEGQGQGQGQGRAFQAHLSVVASARKSRNPFKPSNRVHVFLNTAASDAAAKLDFVQGARDRDAFLEQLKHVLEIRQWERNPIPIPIPQPSNQPGGATATASKGLAQSSPSHSQSQSQQGQGQPSPGGGGGGAEAIFTTRTAGVGGIIRRQEHARAAQDKLASEAFADLSTLMGKAQEVVGVIERYTATVLAAKKAKADEAGTEGAEAESAEAELEGLLQDMGMMANPVTRSSAGSLYHQELARQLAGFLAAGKGKGADLRGRGGMLTLHDAFCLFNRARGTALISPEDLLDACKLLGPLRLGMRLRRFPSGVSVVEADDFSDTRVGERLAALVAAEEDGSLTALEVAGKLHVSITLAQEFLKTAEAGGHLCRDESIHGLLFYPNRFPDFDRALGGGSGGQGNSPTKAAS